VTCADRKLLFLRAQILDAAQVIVSPLLWARGVSNVLLENSAIANGPAVVRKRKYSCMDLDDAKDVMINRLKVNDASPQLNAVVVVGKKVAPGESGIKISGLKLNVPPTAKPVLDCRAAAVAAKP